VSTASCEAQCSEEDQFLCQQGLAAGRRLPDVNSNSVQGPLWFERLLAAGGRDSLVGLSVIGVGTRPGSIKAGIPS
jgi:hypothetical protein